MDDITNRWIFEAIDGNIAPEDFHSLQDAIESDDEVRQQYLLAVRLVDSLGELAVRSTTKPSTPVDAAVGPQSFEDPMRRFAAGFGGWTRLGIAAALLLLVAGVAFWVGQRQTRVPHEYESAMARPTVAHEESHVIGHATLRRAIDLRWPSSEIDYREGDVLPNGVLQFDSGIAVIDFFCGATMILEGPARMKIESDWSAEVTSGRLRANVPPAARGFAIKAAGSEIVDLGTEFTLEVKPGNARVEVVDGEVEIRGGEHDGNRLLAGERRWLEGTETPNPLDDLSTVAELRIRQEIASTERFEQWQAFSEKFRADERLIAYFPIEERYGEKSVPNRAITGADADGKVVGPAEPTVGRFGPESSGLKFHRLGSRVRTRIDGEYQAFTFSCWARIDSLEHRYNALFMGDGYENGEPHWQIREDGRLMFSIMVDDSRKIEYFSEIDRRIVRQAGLHRVYFTEPIWDISQSGRWFHLVAVYDPADRRVRQYVNGELVGDEAINEKYFVDRLRIGAAELGNWGQPFRKTPAFAVRNLNGTIDELAIFNAALSTEEIEEIYEGGKPLGH